MRLGRSGAATCWTKLRWSGCASARSSRWIFRTSCLTLMADIAAHRQARPRAAAIRLRHSAAPDASQVSSAPLCRPHREGSRLDAGLRRRRRRNDRISRRDRSRIRRIARVHRKPAVHVSARIHLFGTARDAGGGNRSGKFPRRFASDRTTVLRELSARKNREFRIAKQGRTLSAVTLEDGWTAVSSDYLKIALAAKRAPNQIVEVRIGGLTSDGLSETGALTVL